MQLSRNDANRWTLNGDDKFRRRRTYRRCNLVTISSRYHLRFANTIYTEWGWGYGVVFGGSVEARNAIPARA